MFQYLIMALLLVLSIFMTTSNSKSTLKMVSVVIPAFNEEKSIEHVISVVKEVKEITQIIVVNDGSTDNTEKIVSNIDGVTLINHKVNKGKGSAMKTGLREVTGQIVLFLDADLSEINKSQVEAIIQPIIDNNADITKTKFKREAGRVTELTAKPLLQFFFPELSFEQPLSGQFAAIKSFLDKIDLEKDYGVDIGIVLDAEALGMRIQEVDIGDIVHEMSSLKELNLMANEVVRTIVDRAISYGRLTMMDELGYGIRMEIMALSITMFGIFALFFIKFITTPIAALILLVGFLLSIFYLIKIIRKSIRMYRQSKIGFWQMTKSFIHMHFPIIISVLIILAIVMALLGSVKITSNEISIEPATKNLVISNSGTSGSSVDVRGPYTIESALENEPQYIRLSNSALNTLQAQYGDFIYIGGDYYQLEQAVNNETGIIRIPEAARNELKVETGTVIRDSDLRGIFDQCTLIRNIEPDEGKTTDERYLRENLSTINYTNVNLSVGKHITTNQSSGKLLNVYVNGSLAGQTTGHLNNDTYNIYVNNELYESLELNESSTGRIANFSYAGSDISVILEDAGNTTNVFLSSNDKYKFLNIGIKNNYTY